jgi:hypothetical protein
MELERDVGLIGEGDDLLDAALGEERGVVLSANLLRKAGGTRRSLLANTKPIKQHDVLESLLCKVVGETRSKRSGSDDNGFGGVFHSRSFPFGLLALGGSWQDGVSGIPIDDSPYFLDCTQILL